MASHRERAPVCTLHYPEQLGRQPGAAAAVPPPAFGHVCFVSRSPFFFSRFLSHLHKSGVFVPTLGSPCGYRWDVVPTQ